MEISEYHPFKSTKLKEKFLKAYDQIAEDWPVPSETRLIETSYGKTFVRISGPTEGKPLILLHGAGSNSSSWISSIKSFSAHFRVYAIDDFYGPVRSISTQIVKDANDYLNCLNELFNALKLENDINMVGLSYGGWLISQYALRFSNRLNKIVLLAPAATVLPIRMEFFVRAILMIFPLRYFIRSFYFWLFEDWAKKDKNALEKKIDMAFLTSQCFKYKLSPRPTVLDDNELNGIKTPTLFLVGENEKIYSAQAAMQRFNKVAPQIKTEIISNVGHDLLFVETDFVNTKVLGFLKGP